jgi:REP element-mobilizing transposase RayT
MAQSFASILVHLIYSTKNREPWLTPALNPELYAYQAAVLKEMGCPALVINDTADHVHTLFRLGRTVALCDVVEEVKKSSSRWLKTKGPALAGFAWQAGYGAFSLGESSVPAARRYIEGQKEHHRKRTFQDEFRAFLAKYRIEYDERYVWD